MCFAVFCYFCSKIEKRIVMILVIDSVKNGKK